LLLLPDSATAAAAAICCVQSPLFKAMKQGIPKVLDAFCERLQQRIYIEGTEIVKEGPVTRLFFILKGSVSRFSTRTMDLGQDMLGQRGLSRGGAADTLLG